MAPRIFEIPSRHLWDPVYLRARNAVLPDDRPSAPGENLFWVSNLAEAGHFLHGFESLWLPRSLLEPGRREQLVEALFAATRHWPVNLHFQKALAGASEEAISAVQTLRRTPRCWTPSPSSSSPAGNSLPILAYPATNLTSKRRGGRRGRSKNQRQLRKVAPEAGTYGAESSFFERNWQRAYWGPNYPAYSRSRRSTTPRGCSLCITVSAARNGASTVSRGWRDLGKPRGTKTAKSQARH